jgi:glucose-1-phosphate cytidylyltransferase
MKAVILAGGFGTRISEESQFKPKPMIEIGGKPILWHIIKHFEFYGVTEFIICSGYRAEAIKDYFSKYFLYNSDVKFNIANNSYEILDSRSLNISVVVADTGLKTMTGGRLKRIQKYVGNEPFYMTYGDAVSDVNLSELRKFHESLNSAVTMTAVKPEGRFGLLEISEDKTVNSFKEKAKDNIGYVNGGYMILTPKVFDYIDGDADVFERESLEKMTELRLVRAFEHDGFWQCMDTMRDKEYLEKLWNNTPPWRIWE